jgi:hypothetical protein
MTTYRTKNEARIAAKKAELEWESKEWNLYFWLWVATIAEKKGKQKVCQQRGKLQNNENNYHAKQV